MDETAHQGAQRLAELAGIHVPPERLPAFEASLQMARWIAQALSAVQYGEIDPACPFRAPVAKGR